MKQNKYENTDYQNSNNLCLGCLTHIDTHRNKLKTKYGIVSL